MITVDINIPRKEYPIYITSDYEELGKCIKKHCGDVKLFVVTDTNVNKHQADSCIGNLKSLNFDVCKYVFEAGEKQKNLKTIEDIYSFLLDNNADRDSVIVALGGGVVGDVAGFAAATYLRGIDFVQVPTTVLSQADSSVGGKVGVDFKSAKNIVGAFYQPKMVYINVKSIETLHDREIKAGLAEVVKHGIIRDADFFEYIEKNIEKVFEFDEDVLQYIAKQDCIIKEKLLKPMKKNKAFVRFSISGILMGMLLKVRMISKCFMESAFHLAWSRH